MAKTARHPFVSIRCPFTYAHLMVKEAKDGSTWKWLHRGKYYDTLDDVIEARRKKFSKELDYGQ